MSPVSGFASESISRNVGSLSDDDRFTPLIWNSTCPLGSLVTVTPVTSGAAPLSPLLSVYFPVAPAGAAATRATTTSNAAAPSAPVRFFVRPIIRLPPLQDMAAQSLASLTAH